MPTTAKLRHLRIAPRKTRQVSDLVRGKSAKEAQTILHFTTRKAALPILKLLRQAVSNFKQQGLEVEEKDLYISKITVDEGPKLKRWMPRARGQVSEIQKKTSHITLVLEEITKQKPKKKRKEQKKAELVKVLEQEKIFSKEKPKFRPEVRFAKPKVEKGTKRIFKRKAF